MQTEAKSGGEKRAPDGDFGLGVLSENSGHHSAADLRGDDVCH